VLLQKNFILYELHSFSVGGSVGAGVGASVSGFSWHLGFLFENHLHLLCDLVLQNFKLVYLPHGLKVGDVVGFFVWTRLFFMHTSLSICHAHLFPDLLLQANLTENSLQGLKVGEFVGFAVGNNVGEVVGEAVGNAVGFSVFTLSNNMHFALSMCQAHLFCDLLLQKFLFV